MNKLFKHVGADVPAAVVVFLVALPLCLGVAVASDAAPVTGIIAGIVGGLVIGALSGSPLSVSGPAAGLTAIVAAAIANLGTYETFLLSVVLAGVLQLLLGVLKAGMIGDFVPNAVINGMLSAIGLILILKQLPHFVGYDADPEGDESFLQPNGENTFSFFLNGLNAMALGAVIIGLVAILILMLFEQKRIKSHKVWRLVPGPLVVVLAGVGLNQWFAHQWPQLVLSDDHLVMLDIFDSPSAFFQSLPSPNFNAITNSQVWITAVTIALVASLESLLSVEAIDKLDPEKRLTPTNRELKAQGIGNMVSGLLGGLPVTSVIVRSSANVHSGGHTKLSTMVHGFLLLVAVLFLPTFINLIPKASLAAILIFTGYKLAKPSLFKSYFSKGYDQFIPFVITIIAILLSDLLIGICFGLFTGLFFVLRSNFKSAIFVMKDEHRYLIRFRKDVSFFNKGVLKQHLENLPDNVAVLVDATKSKFIDRDIIDLMDDFIINAETRGIRVYIKYSGDNSMNFFNDISKRTIK